MPSPFVRLGPLWLFCAIAGFLLLTHGTQLVLTNDEGIILDAASRMVSGQKLYVDFFGYMSPGSYWLQYVAFTVFGVNFWAGRLVVILDFAAQCALLYVISRRLADAKTARVAVGIFFLLQFVSPGLVTAQHRWDSATLAFASVYCALRSADRESRWLAAASGFLVAYGVICTPSIGLLTIVTVAWFWWRKRWMLGGVYIAGGVACAGLSVAILALTGTLSGFLNQMAWLSLNYSDVNVMPYGSIISGYETLFEGASGPDLIIRGGIVFCLALPAILPVVAVGGWIAALILGRGSSHRKEEIIYLLAAQVAMVVSAYPRPDVMHLAFFVCFGHALMAALAHRAIPGRITAAVTFAVAVFAMLFGIFHFFGRFADVVVTTPAGRLRSDRDTGAAVADLVAQVRPGDSVFVHPYMPLLYFLTGARNPTPFSFLAPGMMTEQEESQALSHLTRSPPQWVIYLDLPRDEFLRLFPTATGLSHRFERLDQWIISTYEVVPQSKQIAGYMLMRRKASSYTQ